jgi:hypothetical protein
MTSGCGTDSNRGLPNVLSLGVNSYCAVVQIREPIMNRLTRSLPKWRHLSALLERSAIIYIRFTTENNGPRPRALAGRRCLFTTSVRLYPARKSAAASRRRTRNCLAKRASRNVRTMTSSQRSNRDDVMAVGHVRHDRTHKRTVRAAGQARGFGGSRIDTPSRCETNHVDQSC